MQDGASRVAWLVGFKARLPASIAPRRPTRPWPKQCALASVSWQTGKRSESAATQPRAVGHRGVNPSVSMRIEYSPQLAHKSKSEPSLPLRTYFCVYRPAVHESGAMVPAAGCALGAWLGAIPLCLDWERPWQVGRGNGRLGRGWGGFSFVLLVALVAIRRKARGNIDIVKVQQ